MMLVLLFALELLVGPASATVLLTYPTPRSHSTDFTHSQPDGDPCGVGKGNVTTNFPSGESFNVTWYLSYPSKGNYEIELLDLTDGRQIPLTSNQNIQPGVEQHRVTLPKAVTCRNCTLRLSWMGIFDGNKTQYSSCADVSIVERREYKETCNNHGRAVLGRCRCEKLYHGEKCQFKDECNAHRQCGKYGRCLQLSTQRYPRKRCACKVGYFGNICQHRNPPAMRKKPTSLLLYSSQRLSPDIVLYWRALPDSQELEVVVKANTTSYLAIGWRPRRLPPSCRKPGHKGASQDAPNDGQRDSATSENATTISTTVTGQSSTATNTITQSRLAREIGNSTEMEVSQAPADKNASANIESDQQSGSSTDKESSGERALSGMECVDMVIARAEGEYGVVEDYFSDGKRTPQLDEKIGGKQSLSATLVYEEQGSTTMMFRKKISAIEDQDHSLAGRLDVVWAIGQTPDPGNNTTNDQFYRQDQVQYHGSGTKQRGITDLELVPDNEKEVANSTIHAYDVCGSEWLWPPSCSMSLANCDYGARWEYLDEEDAIRFTIQSAKRDNWLGIGFSTTPTMSDSDIIMGHVQWSGRVTLHDRWSYGHLLPGIDKQQDLSDITGTVKNGRQEISFVRKRDTSDSRDLAFSDRQCLFLLFPVGGGKYSAKWKRFSRHETTPLVSAAKVCIKSCRSVNLVGIDGEPLPPPPPPYLYYEVRLLLGDMDSDVHIPVTGTKEFEYISDRIRKDSEGVFREVPGFKKLEIRRLISSSKGPVVQMSVKIKRKDLQKEMDRAKEQNQDAKTLIRVLNSTVNEGKVGRLKVSPQYVYVKEVTDDPVLTRDEHRNLRTETDPTTRGWLQFSIIGAMLLAATLHAHRKCRQCAKSGHAKSKEPEKQSMRAVPSSNYWRQIAERANRLPHEPDNAPGRNSAHANSQTYISKAAAEKRQHTASRNINITTRRQQNTHKAETVNDSVVSDSDITDWEDVRENQYARNWKHVENNRKRGDKHVCFHYS